MSEVFRHRGKIISADDIAFLRRFIADNSALSRWSLSRKLCEVWGWKQANGALRDMVCRGLLLQLERAGVIELPAARPMPQRRVGRKRPELVAVDTVPLCATLGELQPLQFQLVRRTPQEKLFNSLLEQYHYLGYEQPVGEHLKYLVCGQGRAVACLAWSSAPRHLSSRDRFIGWSAEARRRNIHLLAYNTRFLILPWVQIPHLASHILGRMSKLVSRDWQSLYTHPIYYLETFVDPARFRGTCYRAANWQVVGRTTGRGNNAPTHKPTLPIKEVLGLPLTPRFRELLGS